MDDIDLFKIKDEIQRNLYKLAHENNLDSIQVIRILSMLTQDVSNELVGLVTIIAK